MQNAKEITKRISKGIALHKEDWCIENNERNSIIRAQGILIISPMHVLRVPTYSHRLG